MAHLLDEEQKEIFFENMQDAYEIFKESGEFYDSVEAWRLGVMAVLDALIFSSPKIARTIATIRNELEGIFVDMDDTEN